jgi:hypothetical protein
MESKQGYMFYGLPMPDGIVEQREGDVTLLQQYRQMHSSFTPTIKKRH